MSLAISRTNRKFKLDPFRPSQYTGKRENGLNAWRYETESRHPNRFLKRGCLHITKHPRIDKRFAQSIEGIVTANVHRPQAKDLNRNAYDRDSIRQGVARGRNRANELPNDELIERYPRCNHARRTRRTCIDKRAIVPLHQTRFFRSFHTFFPVRDDILIYHYHTNARKAIGRLCTPSPTIA